MQTLSARTLLLIATAISFGGCIGSDPGGTLEIRWTIGAGTQSCDEAGIEEVQIFLEEADGPTLGPFTTSCAAGRPGPFQLVDVDPGSYTIVIDGFVGGRRTLTGESNVRYSVASRRVVMTETIVLSPVPASMNVLWRFADGRQCGFHSVEQINIRLFLNNSIAEDVLADCAAGQHLIEDVLAATYDVQATGLSAAGAPLFRFTAAGVVVVAGAETEVDDVLQNCADVIGGCN